MKRQSNDKCQEGGLAVGSWDAWVGHSFPSAVPGTSVGSGQRGVLASELTEGCREGGIRASRPPLFPGTGPKSGLDLGLGWV
jgi:hypothetical protein